MGDRLLAVIMIAAIIAYIYHTNTQPVVASTTSSQNAWGWLKAKFA